MALVARTLLPASFTGGEKPTIAILPGTTATMPPPTPVLAGRPGDISPCARFIVEARHHHDREHARNILRVEATFLGDGIDAAVGERGAHDRQLFGGHADGALLGIHIRRFGRIAEEIAVVVTGSRRCRDCGSCVSASDL